MYFCAETTEKIVTKQKKINTLHKYHKNIELKENPNMDNCSRGKKKQEQQQYQTTQKVTSKKYAENTNRINRTEVDSCHI